MSQDPECIGVKAKVTNNSDLADTTTKMRDVVDSILKSNLFLAHS